MRQKKVIVSRALDKMIDTLRDAAQTWALAEDKRTEAVITAAAADYEAIRDKLRRRVAYLEYVAVRRREQRDEYWLKWQREVWKAQKEKPTTSPACGLCGLDHRPRLKWNPKCPVHNKRSQPEDFPDAATRTESRHPDLLLLGTPRKESGARSRRGAKA